MLSYLEKERDKERNKFQLYAYHILDFMGLSISLTFKYAYMYMNSDRTVIYIDGLQNLKDEVSN